MEPRHGDTAVTANRGRWVVLALVALPAAARADAGTPLIWAGALHLLVGNFLIGILEGSILARVFGLAKLRSKTLLVLANYFSTLAGGLFLMPWIAGALPITVDNVRLGLVALLVLTYALTLLLEFPFVAMAVTPHPNWAKRALKGSLLVQTISCAILVGWYWLASAKSLVTENRVVSAAAMTMPPNVEVYFIGVEDGDVYAGSLRERKWQRVFALGSTDAQDRMLAVPGKRPGVWELVARLEGSKPTSPRLQTVFQRPMPPDAIPVRTRDAEVREEDGTGMNFGDLPRLGSAESSQWTIRTGFWAWEGLQGFLDGPNTTVGLTLEAPFLDWQIRNGIHLPGDKVLLQIGTDQICVYDPVRRELALIARGRGPVAVLEPLGDE